METKTVRLRNGFDLSLNLITIFLVLALSGNCSNAYSKNDFPEGFAFGAAISAYQWEGAADEDGRTPSFWDTFVHTRNEDNGDIACDGYHKYKEDVQLMVETGLDALRFSVSWSRLIPNGRGIVNPKGLQFYKNFIQELVNNGIEPHVTLFHYDLPQSLEDEYGGWTNRKSIEDFTAYADVCFREFGNLVKFWTTINEGNVFTLAGYDDGTKPPARCTTCLLGNSSTEPYIVGHNLLLAHASASRLYKQKYKDTQGGSVGYSIFFMGTNPNDDKVTVQRAIDFNIGWMLRPLIFGDYPDVMKRSIGSRLPDFSEEESELVKGSSDFIGVIYYFPIDVTEIKPSLSATPDFYSDMGLNMSIHWEYPVAPRGMEEVLEYLKESYGNPPVYILENGKPLHELNDKPRIEYLDAYIGAALKAVRNGSDTRGYFVWSFMDVFELLIGYDIGFGLYYVNFTDPELKRTPKLSAHWYSAFLKGSETTSLTSQSIVTKLHSNFSSSTSS